MQQIHFVVFVYLQHREKFDCTVVKPEMFYPPEIKLATCYACFVCFFYPPKIETHIYTLIDIISFSKIKHMITKLIRIRYPLQLLLPAHTSFYSRQYTKRSVFVLRNPGTSILLRKSTTVKTCLLRFSPCSSLAHQRRWGLSS
ncbi:MAG: uncharacterized protein A8A55_1571 [Amphiamblys sp. WSBS2006]|nr:MAG: uncharacterized protein A8A55_1571 [Amphiamblys sp. WSBS2006]